MNPLIIALLVACIFGGGVLVGYGLARRDSPNDGVRERWAGDESRAT